MNQKLAAALFTAFSLAIAPLSAEMIEPVQGPSLLEQISDAIADLADRAKPAAVSIKCTLTAGGQEFGNPFDMFEDDFFRRFFGPQLPPNQAPQQEQISGGSGFLISPEGYIVTNHHVIKNANRITVTLNDGSEHEASVKGFDARTDLAVLKIETEKDLPYLVFGNSDALRAGNMVFAVGNPFGLEGTITQGIVSSKGRQDLGIAAYEDFIQTDTAINPGNSGGPLLNVRGEVVGVNTAILSRTGGYMGIGLSIPSSMAQPVIDQIINQGSVKRAYLGVILQPIDKELAEALGLDKPEGILVSDIVKDSPASQAGLQQGDIIVQYNSKPVKTVNQFRNDIAMMLPGSTLQLKILRNGKQKSFTIELGAQSEGEAIKAELIQKLGIELENLRPEIASKLGYSMDVSGVVIAKVKPNSPAWQAGLRPYFLITGISLDGTNQKPIKDICDFETALQDVGDRKYIILIVRHQNFQRYYTVKLN